MYFPPLLSFLTQGPMHLTVGQGFGVILVLGMAVWSRRLAREVIAGNVHQKTKRFNKAMSGARMMIPASVTRIRFTSSGSDTRW